MAQHAPLQIILAKRLCIYMTLLSLDFDTSSDNSCKHYTLRDMRNVWPV